MIPLLLRAPVMVRVGNSMAGLLVGLCAVAVLASTVPTWWGDAEFAVACSPVVTAVGYLVVRAWRDGGRRRWTPLTAFWVSSDPFGLVFPAAEDALRLLRLWWAPVDYS